MSTPTKRAHSPEKLENGTKQKRNEKDVGVDAPGDFAEDHIFSNFIVDRLLGEISQQKIAFVQGHYEGSEYPAVVILEKTPFSNEAVKSILGAESQTVANLKNDIYQTFSLVPEKEHNGMKDSWAHFYSLDK